MRWMMTWTGDLLSAILVPALVGAPLSYLPLWAGSSIPLLLSLLALGLLTSMLFLYSTGIRSGFVAVLVALSAGTVWVTSFLASSIFNLPKQVHDLHVWFSSLATINGQVAGTLLHWQTVNVQYVFLPALMIAALFLVIRCLNSNWPLGVALIVGWGFLVGGGPLLGLSALLVVPFVVLYFFRPAFQWRLVATLLAFAFATVAGVIFGITTPGAMARREFFPESDYVGAVLNSLSDLPLTLVYWASALFAVPNLAGLIFGLSLAAIFQGRRPDAWNSKDNRELKLVGLLLASSLVIFLVNSVLEELVYPAFWHTITARMLMFAAAVVVGSWMFIRASTYKSNFRRSVLTLVPISLFSLSFIFAAIVIPGAIAVHESATNRLLAWDIGDAAIEGVGDISSEWVLVCAREIPNPYWENVVKRYPAIDD